MAGKLQKTFRKKYCISWFYSMVQYKKKLPVFIWVNKFSLFLKHLNTVFTENHLIHGYNGNDLIDYYLI